MRRANDWFKRYGAWASAMSLYPSITCTHHNPTGINKMNVVTFVVLSLLGTTIWNFALILLGRMLSGSFDALMVGLHIYSYIMYVIIILAVLLRAL